MRWEEPSCRYMARGHINFDGGPQPEGIVNYYSKAGRVRGLLMLG